jgi:primosomal protein N' (replication factor Y)
LSGELVAALEGVAERRSRAIVLLNRRGVAPAVHCRSCGTTIRCEDCDVALVLHRDDVLRCHHCGRSRAAAELCAVCGSPELMRIGAGTQRLEAELARLVPGLERIRLDADTISKPAELAAALDAFRTSRGAVLLGTQMVAKGHHFAGVELAAVVDADLGLALPDFRAEERTFQLVTQLAGRSGRDAPGRVIVQTFQPDAPALLFAARHDVPGFLAAELPRRKALGYPPFCHIVRVLVSGRTADGPIRALTELKARLGDGVAGPAALTRLRGRHRAQLVAKTETPRAMAARAGSWLAAAAVSMRQAGLSATIDVDPQSF